MKVVVVGATGTIGREVVLALAPRHDVVRVGWRSGDLNVDLGARGSVEALFDGLQSVDAVVCAAGLAKFGHLAVLTDQDFLVGLTNKLMGQVNLVRVGTPYVTDEGSITLTSGLLAHTPMPGSAAISMVNAGLEGFVRAAALEAPRGIRINAVSPVFVKETMEAMGVDSSSGMPAAMVAHAYVASVEGKQSGEVLDVRDFV
jgi:NAD(P)-dependent dehydrogenase (short-subunit alcohol dehydrogenase family)